jgi:CBS domain-containing protein
MKAKDLMIPLKGCLKPENTIREAVNFFRTAEDEQTGVIGLPVCNAVGKLVGMLFMEDVLKAIYPSYMSMMNLAEFTWDGMLESLACKAGDRQVTDVMTTEVTTLSEDDPLMECLDHMLKENIRKMPVLNKAGDIVGTIYLRDIFFAVTQAMLDETCKQ